MSARLRLLRSLLCQLLYKLVSSVANSVAVAVHVDRDRGGRRVEPLLPLIERVGALTSSAAIPASGTRAYDGAPLSLTGRLDPTPDVTAAGARTEGLTLAADGAGGGRTSAARPVSGPLSGPTRWHCREQPGSMRSPDARERRADECEQPRRRERGPKGDPGP